MGNRQVKKSCIAVVIASALCIGAVGLMTAQAGGGYPEKEITIDGKKPAKFKHDSHVKLGIACGKCHHDAKHQELTAETIGAMADKAGLKCTTCHNEKFTNPKFQVKKEVFHANCQGCHKAGFNGKPGPTKCTECHVGGEGKKPEGC